MNLLQFPVISAIITYFVGFIFCYYIISSTPQLSSFEEKTQMNDIGKKLMDTFYISHGAPTLCIDESLPARHFLKTFRKKVYKEKPAAVLVISGHWDTREPIVNSVDFHETIYDFYGFPKSMYKLKYNAPGSPELAQRVKELLKASGVKQVKEDTKRGLDHGAWVPLMLMYPEADIPVVQLSVQGNKDATYHYNIGKALAPLREEGVLIVGSGAATHNLRSMRHDDGTVDSWAEQFDNWLKDSLLNGRYEEVNNYREKAPHAKVAHPHPDHFFPLHVAMGAAGANSKAKLIHHSWSMGSLSYASYQFASPN